MGTDSIINPLHAVLSLRRLNFRYNGSFFGDRSLHPRQPSGCTYIHLGASTFHHQGHLYPADTRQGVYVNGIDQGTFKGVRVPAYNGAPGKGGYNNGPVKDLSSIDLRCNVMGDIQTLDTIKVVPGDSLTFDW
jgi:hypothetical protein